MYRMEPHWIETQPSHRTPKSAGIYHAKICYYRARSYGTKGARLKTLAI